jgi:hypothetical protein
MIDVLIEKFDVPEELLPKELASLSSLNLSGRGISDLTGIERPTNCLSGHRRHLPGSICR